jgi:anti-sigma regulatory factor (Ser/Thr protein kinase)
MQDIAKEVLLLTDRQGTPSLDKSITAVTVLADAELLPAVVGVERRAAHQLGLREKDVEHLDQAVGTVRRNIINHALELDEEGQYDAYVFRGLGVGIAVEDRSQPFDYVPLQEGSDMALPTEPSQLHRPCGLRSNPSGSETRFK